MNTTLKRILSILMSLLMAAGVFAIFGTQQAHAAKKYKLPKKIVKYYFEDGKWHKSDAFKGAYDKKGNIIKYRHTKYKNTYKKGKLYTTCVKADGFKSTMYYSSKGRAFKQIYDVYNYNNKILEQYVFKYKTNKRGYIIKTTGKQTVGKNEYDNHPVKNIIKHYKNGIPKSIRTESKNIMKFNSKGLVTSVKLLTSEYEPGDGIKDEYTYYRVAYKKKKGRIVANIDSKVVGGTTPHGWEKCERVVYIMGSAKSRNSREYAAVMGSSICDMFNGAFPEFHTEVGWG